jgi:hypothetical protein
MCCSTSKMLHCGFIDKYKSNDCSGFFPMSVFTYKCYFLFSLYGNVLHCFMGFYFGYIYALILKGVGFGYMENTYGRNIDIEDLDLRV